MSDFPESAVQWNGSTPSLDFTKTTAYPVGIRQRGKIHPAYAYFTPYTPDELKAILRKATAGYRREKRDVEIVREDRSIYVPLCDAHFVKFDKAGGSVDQQRAWLDANADVKAALVEATFGGLLIDVAKSEDDTDDVLDISLELSDSVPTYQEIYDPVTSKVVRVDMIHTHTHPTEGQYRAYRGARRSKFIGSKTLWTVSEQHNTLEKLYDDVIQSIEGGIVSGKPCTKDTKSAWLPFVPLWHKLWVVDHIFGDLIEKNA